MIRNKFASHFYKNHNTGNGDAQIFNTDDFHHIILWINIKNSYLQGRESFMNTKHLSYFLEIAKQKNMNKAAESLFVSQSSLSQYLSRLEEELGALLFYRQKGNMTLTQAGEIYYRYAKQVLDLEQEMLHGIAGLSASSHIRIGVNSIWGNLLVSSITPMFYTKYPGSSIQVIEGNHIQLKKKIQEGALDIAVLATDSLDHVAGFKKILRTEEILFAVSNKNSARTAYPALSGRLTFQELIRYFGQESYILNKPSSSFRPSVDAAFAACNFHPNIICEVSNMNTARTMVDHNIGVSFIPESAADPSLDISCFFMEPKITRIIGLICRDTLTFTQEEQYFIDLAVQYS